MPYDGVFSNGTQLFVDDQMNNRILVWNTFPTANFTPPMSCLASQTPPAAWKTTTAPDAPKADHPQTISASRRESPRSATSLLLPMAMVGT